MAAKNKGKKILFSGQILEIDITDDAIVIKPIYTFKSYFYSTVNNKQSTIYNIYRIST